MSKNYLKDRLSEGAIQNKIDSKGKYGRILGEFSKGERRTPS